MTYRILKFRLYPTNSQAELLNGQLADACRLYNAAIQERREAWKLERKSVTFYNQTYQLKEILGNGDCGTLSFSAAWHVLDRVNKSFQAFFRRVAEGQTPGFPRYKSARRYDSLTWQVDPRLNPIRGSQVQIPKIGKVKLKLHRPIDGKIKTATVKREAGRWFVCLAVECERRPLPSADQTVGIDMGLSAFATLSDGTAIENPRFYAEAQPKLRRAQRKVARRKGGSGRRRKAVQDLARIYAHVRNQRANFHHQQSHSIVTRYGLIIVEDLKVKAMARGSFAASISDAGWSSFIEKLSYKAEDAGRRLVKVDPRGTSQRCVCGARVAKELWERWHACESCGLSVPRDHAAALEILRLGLSLQALTCPAGESVA